MKTINTKSFLIGLLFGVCALLALGAASGKQEDVGRYQVVCPYTNSSSTCFVIDTTTGRLWKRRSRSSGDAYGSPAEWDKDG